MLSGNEKSVRRHCGLLQLASAAVQVLRHPGNAKTDSLLAEEKGLLQCIGDEDSVNVFDQIVKNIHQQLKLAHNERYLSFCLTEALLSTG